MLEQLTEIAKLLLTETGVVLATWGVLLGVNIGYWAGFLNGRRVRRRWLAPMEEAMIREHRKGRQPPPRVPIL